MINVNQITSELARMPDQALQQYAAMHKSDPYTVSLALAEANRRKEIRNSAHMPQGQQPKVVDQEIAGMHALPEEQGIGQLPAPNIQGMAGGGIVAFDEGGHVPSYAGTTDGSLVQSDGYWDPNTGEYVINAPADTRSFGEKFARAINYNAGLNIDPRGGIAKATPVATPAVRVPQGGAEPVRMNTATDPRVAAMQSGIAAGVRPSVGQPVADNQPQPPTPAQTGIGAPAPSTGSFEKKFMDMLSKGEVSKEDRIKEMTDINKPVLEKMTSLIEDNKNKLKTEGEQNFYMSLIQGGLAAAGEEGPHAFQNIARGFSKGAGHYSEGLKDLRKAAQENSKMELSMAEYEASGKKDALKSYYDHQDKMQGYKAQGLASIYGHEIAGQYGLAAAGTHAAASAAHAGAQERLISRIGSDPKFAAAYNQYLTSGAEAKLMPQLAAQYAKDPMKLEMLKQTDPMQYQQIKAYLSQQMVPQAMNTPSGNVRQ